MTAGKHMKPYPEYKDSGVEWLGEVPEHWLQKPLYTLSEFRQGKAHEPFVDEDGDFICVNSRYVSTQGGKVKYCTRNRTPARPKDILMVMSDLPNGRALARAYFVEDADKLAVNQRVCAITVKKESPRFLFYQLDRNPHFLKYDDGSNQTHLSNAYFLKYPACLPPLPEQEKIAAFLDYETSRMDRLIEKQEGLIELLKEKRQAVISHAVTKGLDPNVPMKDSGVEWLGEVPEHWACKQYRYATSIYRGKFGHRPRNDPRFYDGLYPFIQTGDIANADKYVEAYKQTLNENGRAVSQKFPAGTLVMAIAANIGDTAILRFAAYAPDSVVGFTPKRDVDLEFLMYSLESSLQAFEQVATQSAQANLNIDRIAGIPAAFPPINEQRQIVDHIEKVAHVYNALRDDAFNLKSLLQERRTALISAAVTGKIDVRDWEPPTPDKQGSGVTAPSGREVA